MELFPVSWLMLLSRVFLLPPLPCMTMTMRKIRRKRRGRRNRQEAIWKVWHMIKLPHAAAGIRRAIQLLYSQWWFSHILPGTQWTGIACPWNKWYRYISSSLHPVKWRWLHQLSGEGKIPVSKSKLVGDVLLFLPLKCSGKWGGCLPGSCFVSKKTQKHSIGCQNWTGGEIQIIIP